MGLDSSPDRRTVLKRLGAAAAASGVAGTAGATGGDRTTMEPQSVSSTVAAVDGQERDVEELVESRAAGVLSALAADGVLSSGSVAELTTTPVAATTDSSVEGVSAYRAVTDDQQERLFTVDTHVADGVLELTVQPDREEVVATVTHDDGRKVLYVDTGDGVHQEDVTADYCCACCLCLTTSCSGSGGDEKEVCISPERFGCLTRVTGCC